MLPLALVVAFLVAISDLPFVPVLKPVAVNLVAALSAVARCSQHVVDLIAAMVVVTVVEVAGRPEEALLFVFVDAGCLVAVLRVAVVVFSLLAAVFLAAVLFSDSVLLVSEHFAAAAAALGLLLLLAAAQFAAMLLDWKHLVSEQFAAAAVVAVAPLVLAMLQFDSAHLVHRLVLTPLAFVSFSDPILSVRLVSAHSCPVVVLRLEESVLLFQLVWEHFAIVAAAAAEAAALILPWLLSFV